LRAVLDPNVLIAALLSPDGTPAQLLRRWIAGDFDLVISEDLISEFERACAYPKIRTRVPELATNQITSVLRASATLIDDPRDPPKRSSDRGDDYLVALAEAASAALVSGDEHLIRLASSLPVYSPRQFADLLNRQE